MGPCAVLVWDQAATRDAGRLVVRACGAPTGSVLTVDGDTMFRVCGRHDQRLRRAFPGYAKRLRA